jgi:aminocarboxymuconate-semialdehyde decarboxylase
MDTGADGARQLITTAGKRGLRAEPVCWDLDERRGAMAARGVDAEVVSPMPLLLGYGLPPEDGQDLCQYVNEFVAELCEADSGHFYGLGIVPLQDPELASRELAELKRRGLLGVEIASNVNGASLGEERFWTFFEEIERLGLAVYVHGMTPTFAERLPASALATFGLGAELVVTAASLLASGVLESCPKLRIALSHGGGGFPFILPRAEFFWGGTWNEEPGVGAGPGTKWSAVSPSALARRFYYDSLVFDRRALRYLVDTLGPQRLMVGTDHPFMEREQPVGKTLRSLDLPPADLDAITWHNCFRWLGIDAPSTVNGAQHDAALAPIREATWEGRA